MERDKQLAARNALREFGVPLGQDFHTLDSDTVERIRDAAASHGYRKSRHAPGSTARMFYEYANRGYGLGFSKANRRR